ncbi:MAG: metallophosphoesterase [Eubacteriales bacterium]|nr:metallophosphoesterase [Eubacteriales bacterium]
MEKTAAGKLKIRTYEIETDRFRREDPSLKLALLADLHNRLWGEEQSLLLGAIKGLGPDMVLCAGDMLVAKGREERMEHALTLFRGLQKMGLPVIASNGNHESRMRQCPERYGDLYGRYASALRDAGVRILSDETATFRHGGGEAAIHGYEMSLAYYRKPLQPAYDRTELTRRFGGTGDGRYHILMAHNPVYFDDYAAWGADLTLAGHLHGGIVRIPGVGGVITPQAKLFPKYDRGLFRKGEHYMVVSAGLGEHTVPIRIFNPPELILITVKGAA